MARNASCKRCDIVSSSPSCHMDGDSMEWQVFQALRRLGADRAAMTLSGLCLVHCLAGVVLFSTFAVLGRSEEHTSELQSLMRISYAVFCLKKKTIED